MSKTKFLRLKCKGMIQTISKTKRFSDYINRLNDNIVFPNKGALLIYMPVPFYAYYYLNSEANSCEILSCFCFLRLVVL